ncbi:MAG: hypothetical protein ACE5IM_02310 [Nitrospinota bacterium]
MAALFLVGAVAVSCAAKSGEIADPLWDYRIEKPASPWVPGRGDSVFADIGLRADHFFHNPFTGGVMAIHVLPLSFRYRDFQLPDHARRIYRRLLEAWGNSLRPVRNGRFLPLEQAWSLRTLNGRPRLEFLLQGSLSRPVIDEEAERRRIEEEILRGNEEERFGPETRSMRRSRIEREQKREQVTRGARGKFVLILKRGWPADVLYEFALLDHELAFPNTVKAFDRMVASFRSLR